MEYWGHNLYAGGVMKYWDGGNLCVVLLNMVKYGRFWLLFSSILSRNVLNPM